MSKKIVAAAFKWWRMKKPVAWTPEQHRFNPQVNCVGQHEKDLANACASYLRWKRRTRAASTSRSTK